jgi:hypothetical protein
LKWKRAQKANLLTQLKFYHFNVHFYIQSSPKKRREKVWKRTHLFGFILFVLVVAVAALHDVCEALLRQKNCGKKK